MNHFIAIFGSDDVPAEEVSGATRVSDAYQLKDNVFLIRSTVTSPDTVGIDLGLTGETGSRIGVVFKLNGSHAGYYYQKVWEWLSAGVEKPVV